MAGTVSLVVTAGPIRGQRFDFTEHDTFLFGRAADCHARLASNDAAASRHHFILEVNPPQACLRDLGSLNGTHVNGVRRGGRRPDESPEEGARHEGAQVDLKDGDEIRVGATHLKVTIEGPAACSECGRPIADDERERCEWVNGTWLCEACRRGTVTHGPGPTNRPGPTTPAADGTSVADLAPGSTVADYRIERLLGQGGMGAVYLARARADGRRIALKLMLPHSQVDEAAQEIFLREIEVTRALRHPNIVELLDFGKHDGRFYFALEYCPGGNADELVHRTGTALGLPAVVRLAVGALEGLAAAHAAGFVHRDIKPDNVLLAEDGTAKLADFGLAKSFQQAGLSGMTATGAVAGTFFFMPREQLTNFRQVRPVSDVWSMAATLYFLLTLEYARDFKSRPDPLAVILRGGVVPIRDRDPFLPDDLANVIDRALMDDPEQRYPDAGEFGAALRAVL
jgi:pSer/pThr/pTyr-binding forkhead associated (FHA) protein